MKRLATFLFILALVPSAASAQSYTATLTGAAEVPGPADADGAGFAVVAIEGTSIRYSVLTQGIGAATAAHIHAGATGTSGNPLVSLDHNALPFGIASNIPQAIIDQIRANPAGFYVNVHTAEFPNGAIRGQLVPAPAGDGERTSFVPVVGKVRGANNTNFVTDLRIINSGSATANVKLDFYAQNAGGLSAPTAAQTVIVAPGEQKALDDVVGTTLGIADGLGALKITSDQAVVVSARIINDLRSTNAGTAGFAVEAGEADATTGTIPFLANSADYRTNLGYYNPGATAVTVTLIARSTVDGAVLGTNTITIPANAMVHQPVFNAISNVPEGSRTQNDFYVTWSANAPLFVYGAVTDNKTGDAVLNQ